MYILWITAISEYFLVDTTPKVDWITLAYTHLWRKAYS